GQGFRCRSDPGPPRKDIRWQLAATRRADFSQERLQALKSRRTGHSPRRSRPNLHVESWEPAGPRDRMTVRVESNLGCDCHSPNVTVGCTESDPSSWSRPQMAMA